MRAVLAEDLYLLRDGLTRLLGSHGIDVTAAVASGPELLDALLADRPDVAIVDVRLPPTFTDEGLRAAIEARRRLPGLPVLVLSQYVEQLYARELLSDRTGSQQAHHVDLRQARPRAIRRRQPPRPRRPGLPEHLNHAPPEPHSP